MCIDNDCPQKETCKRFTTSPGEYKSYFANTPRGKFSDICSYYWGKESEYINEEIEYAGTESSGPVGLTNEHIEEIRKNISYRRKNRLN